MKREKIVDYGIPVLGTLLVAGLGSAFVGKGMAWYKKLKKPTQWLPTPVIPIVWTVVYSLGLAYMIHLVRKEKGNKTVVCLLIINGLLNVLWCLTFFTLHSLLIGQIVIILNLFASVLLIKQIAKTSEVYGYLLLVYPLWLSIATSLNTACWILN